MSVYFTFVISLNCYVAAASTTWSGKLFGGRRKYAILFVPSTSVAFINAGFFLYAGFDGYISSCEEQRMFSQIQTIYNTIRAIQTIPILLATFGLYALAIRAINVRFGNAGKSQISAISNAPQNATDTRRKRHMTALKTLGLIFVSIIILTTPYLTVYPFVHTTVEVNQVVRVIILFGVFLNTLINPVIYTWRLKDFRSEISSMCCHCCRV